MESVWLREAGCNCGSYNCIVIWNYEVTTWLFCTDAIYLNSVIRLPKQLFWNKHEFNIILHQI